jgi:hypothetical protein
MERKFDFSFKTQKEQGSIDNFREEIYCGLDIDGASFLKLPSDVEEGLINDFAKTLIATSKNLQKPLPRVRLIHGWNEPLDGYSENHEIREILANATVDENFPNGIIRISPFYLKPEFTRRFNSSREDESGNAITPLSFLLAHEDFHIWQFLNQYNRVVEDCKALGEGGLAAWNHTQTEIEANEFANNWIKSHKI